MNSLRRKIILGYSLIGALAVALSLFSYVELRLLEDKIGSGARIAEFFDVSLEIRRFEKNYFLYGQAADLDETRAYVARASSLLNQHRPLFESLGDSRRVRGLAADLERYGALMEGYAKNNRSEALASEIRKTGKEIVTVAEELAGAERKTLQVLLDDHRRLLIASIVGVALLVVVIGQLLSRRVVRPLTQMEASMEAVGAGRLAALDMKTDDREIASLIQAFNHVIEELELRQGQLVRSEKLAALGTLLSGVAHELNNPLSNIATSCQILLEELDQDEAEARLDPAFRQELLSQINGETWRARRIVRSLLDYARDREFCREHLQLAPLAEETLRLIRGQIPTRVSVVLEIPDELAIQGDKQRLQQVFINLMRNAVDAVEGKGEVRVAARRQATKADPLPGPGMVFGKYAGHGDAIEIEIRDTGSGIPAATLPRIFDPFFTTKKPGSGMGLGLFIVFEIVEEHGGSIAVDSRPGAGTTFTIRLPCGETNA